MTKGEHAMSALIRLEKPEIKQKVLHILETTDEWLTINEIAKKLGVSFQTVKYALILLFEEQKIEVRRVKHLILVRIKNKT